MKNIDKKRNHLEFHLTNNSINIQTTSLKNNINRNTSFNHKNIRSNKFKKLTEIQLSTLNKDINPKKINFPTLKKSTLKSFVFKKKVENHEKKFFDSNIKYILKSNNSKIKNLSISSKETKIISEEGSENIENIQNNIFSPTTIKNIILNKENDLFSVFHFIKSNNLYIFIKNSKTEEYFKKNNNLQNNNVYEIIENIELPSAYKPRMNKYEDMPQCLIDVCANGNITLIKNEDNCNLIWKLLSPEKMRELIRKLNKNQKFNHFPCTYQIGLKDNMYIHFKLYKKLFPDLYDFVPNTYILPNDAEKFEKIYKKNKSILWIVKPVNMSRGRGVHLLKNMNELKELTINKKI